MNTIIIVIAIIAAVVFARLWRKASRQNQRLRRRMGIIQDENDVLVNVLGLVRL